jgi:prolyl-tRNA synthetase
MLDGESRLVFAVIRGDLEVNETKLANAVGARALRPSTDEEIREVGAEPGYASPVALDEDILTVVDDSIITSPNLVAGANEPGFHLLNVNAGRDFRPHIVADISTAQEGDACSRCGQTLDAVRGVEVGNIFKLGTYYSDPMDATFIDESGKPRSVVMGSYGIGLGRLMACIAESHHDKMGLAWPARVAPYRVHLVGLKGAEEKAADLYDQLWASGIDTLYDDRDERPGVKFKDADLIGCPLRVTVSERSIQSGGMEVKVRTESESTIVTPDELSGWLHERLV